MAFKLTKSLASRIVFYVLSFCVFLFLISLSVFYFFSKKTIEDTTRKNALSLMESTVFKTEQILLTTEKISKNYKWLIESHQLNCDSIMFYTQLIVKNNPEVIGCAIAFEPEFFPEKGYYFSPYTYRENGELHSTYLGSADYDYFIMDWYQIPVTIEQPYWSEPYYDSGGVDALITTYSVPFYRYSGQEKALAGVITIDLSLEWLTDIVSSVRIFETGYASVISRNGTFVTHPKTELIMNQTIFSWAYELESPQLREIGRDMQAGNTNFVSYVKGKTRWMISYTPLGSSGWSLAIVFPRSEMYAPLRQISIVLIILIVVGLGLLTFIITKIVNEQIKPLRYFAKSAREVADGNFDNKLPEIKSEDEMKDLLNSFEHMQKDLKSYIEHLKETTSAKEKIESELRIAREIQMGMIPKIFPPFPDIPEIDIYAMLEPAKEVGGDLYDFFLIDDKHLCIALGDVSGKGVPASLFMAVTRTLLRSIAPKQRSPKVIVDALNKSLSLNNESSMFVTFFLGIINIETGYMQYTNAGHNPPVIISSGGDVKMFEITKDIPIGLFPEHRYEEKEMHFLPSDKIFLYTDGVTEAENWDADLYSEEKLLKCLSLVKKSEPIEIVMSVARDVVIHVNDYLQSDDLTMMCVVYYGK
ncbi:MAG: SpoIIE family protein phosphatase [Prolixibacteraceae bacterium]|nr:SpoIIE family protein phosphatase [Prolixibacteraceae bacterium]